MAGREHVIDPTRVHHLWDADLEPVLAVDSGDVVHFDLRVAGHEQVWPGAAYADTRFDFDTLYHLSGPVHVNGAAPGDTLELELLELVPGDWAWAGFLPGFGLLPEEFPDGYVRTFDLAKGTTATLVPGVEIPLAPFLGVLGNHPGGAARQAPFPPHRGGGNIDNRHLVAGTTVWLPVFADGAMFSAGDPHAAQGDGEVSVTALECPMKASLRITLRHQSSATPSFRVPPGSVTTKYEAGYHATMGLDGDLMTGAKIATRAMVDWLAAEHGLSRADAYLLCSTAADLRIHEIVDAGVWNVGMTLPLSVFQPV